MSGALEWTEGIPDSRALGHNVPQIYGQSCWSSEGTGTQTRGQQREGKCGAQSEDGMGKVTANLSCMPSTR